MTQNITNAQPTKDEEATFNDETVVDIKDVPEPTPIYHDHLLDDVMNKKLANYRHTN